MDSGLNTDEWHAFYDRHIAWYTLWEIHDYSIGYSSSWVMCGRWVKRNSFSSKLRTPWKVFAYHYKEQTKSHTEWSRLNHSAIHWNMHEFEQERFKGISDLKALHSTMHWCSYSLQTNTTYRACFNLTPNGLVSQILKPKPVSMLVSSFNLRNITVEYWGDIKAPKILLRREVSKLYPSNHSTVKKRWMNTISQETNAWIWVQEKWI